MTSEFALKVGMAIGTFFGNGKILIGCDGRISGPMLKLSLSSGLNASGCDVFDIGLTLTPALQFLVRYLKYDGGIMITASHNPPEFNGIKVIDKDGVELPREKEIKIENIFFNKKFSLASWKRIGKFIEERNHLDLYVNEILSHVNVGLIRKKQFKVVVDPANGVGVLAAPRLLRELNCKVYTINSHIDGKFPGRNPEPTPQNLTALSKVVTATGADLGVGYDGDADRAIFVDEKGQVIWGDKTLALLIKFYLKKNPRATVVTPISSSQLIQDVVQQGKGKLVWTKVGSINMSRKMVEIKAELGGEENGGVCYGAHQPVRDGVMSTALILQTMAETDKPLSTLISELPVYYNYKDKIRCPDDLKGIVLKKLLARVKKLDVETLDGAKIWFPDKSWILIRPSGTEPIYRLFAESKVKDKPQKMVKEYKKIIQEIIGVKSES
jgi:phosphomannomutase/phosphoglucomutase